MLISSSVLLRCGLGLIDGLRPFSVLRISTSGTGLFMAYFSFGTSLQLLACQIPHTIMILGNDLLWLLVVKSNRSDWLELTGSTLTSRS